MNPHFFVSLALGRPSRKIGFFSHTFKGIQTKMAQDNLIWRQIQSPASEPTPIYCTYHEENDPNNFQEYEDYSAQLWKLLNAGQSSAAETIDVLAKCEQEHIKILEIKKFVPIMNNSNRVYFKPCLIYSCDTANAFDSIRQVVALSEENKWKDMNGRDISFEEDYAVVDALEHCAPPLK